MQTFHDKTNITLKNSFEQTQFIDWRTQPRNYKTYPKFFRRFNLNDHEELKFIKNFGKVTTTKKYGQEEVKLRANPSAGGLYPCEVYIQIRGVKGVLSGIYHYEPLLDTLTLIHELSSDGIEYYLKDKSSKKFIFLISTTYFRSFWKYEKRATRYLLLDTGHQLGSICSSLNLENISYQIELDFDKKTLNEEFAFTPTEFFQAIVYVDNEKDNTPNKLREPLVSVCPTDYEKRSNFVEEFYKKSINQKFQNINFDFSNNFSQEVIDNRRSIRAFKKEAISKNEFEFIIKDIFDYALTFDIEIFYINNNIKDLEKGSYKNVKLLKSGDFKGISTKLAFNQKLAEHSCFTLFYTCKKESNYILCTILSAFLAHMISLRSTNLNISSSGIGAFFDDMCQKFFNTPNNILYLQAVGR
jgi:SagB-type dehydrogenase family enzyme